jgi:hypothetical protein
MGIMFIKSLFGLAGVIACSLQMASTSMAEIEGEPPGISGAVQGPCRIAGARSGAESWKVDLYIYTGDRCWQFYGPAVTGVTQYAASRCGTFVLTQNGYGWEFTAGSQPCIETIPLKLVVNLGGQQYTLDYEFTINVEPR